MRPVASFPTQSKQVTMTDAPVRFYVILNSIILIKLSYIIRNLSFVSVLLAMQFFEGIKILFSVISF